MPLIKITPQRTSLNYFSEVWQNRDLLRAFTVRDLKLRYKQTALGIAWVILQPLLGAFIFTLVFGNVFNSNSTLNPQETPYALIVFSGLVFWNFFSDSVTFGANSLLTLGDVIKKIYFPRIISPLSSILVASVNFIVNLILLFLIMIIGFPQHIHWLELLTLPLVILLLLLPATGLALLFSALNLKYRDIKHALPFMMQLLLFCSPVVYPTSILPEPYAQLAYLNPLTAVINSVRYLFFNSPLPTPQEYLLSIISALLIFALGFIYFRATEKYFADIA